MREENAKLFGIQDVTRNAVRASRIDGADTVNS